MHQALKTYSKVDKNDFEDISTAISTVKDTLDLLAKLFHGFDTSRYFNGSDLEMYSCLSDASEFVQKTKEFEYRFMSLVKKLKLAYDICCGSEELSQSDKDHVHFYLAIRSIIHKLTKGDAPDTARMNAKVAEMIEEALKSDGVEEVVKIADDSAGPIDLFDEDFLAKIDKIKLPNTKAKLLQKLLEKAIEDFKKTNKTKATDFSKKMKKLVDNYNDRKEQDVHDSTMLSDLSNEILKLVNELKEEQNSHSDLGIDVEEKAFYDILKQLTVKYEFEYAEEKLISLSKLVKTLVDDQAKFPDWSQRVDIQDELRARLVMLLAENDYPPIDKDEVYREIFEQAENFKRNSQKK